MKKSTEETKKVNIPPKGIVITISILAGLLVLAGAFLGYAASYTKILPNVLVEGINVGGMMPKTAEEKIHASFADVAKGRDVKLVCNEDEETVSFDELNLKPNAQKTAENAYKIGREEGVFKKAVKILTLLFKTEDVDLMVDFDKEQFDNIISRLAEGKEEEAAQTGYILEDDKLTITKGHGGKGVDRALAAEMFSEAARDSKINEINLEVKYIEANKPDLEKFYQELTAPMKDAKYVLKNGEIYIEPEHIGIKVEKSKIKEALDSGQQNFTLDVETFNPEVTKEMLEGLLFRDTLGSFSSSFATSTNARASNVILTANRINGKILMPGDVFSYDKTIGRRTVANGYKEAGVYIGNKVESGIGGGICQTSSTLYSAVLYSNLEIVSRTSHSLPVSYVPLGQDATIAEGAIDFKFKNNTNYPIKIVAVVNGRRLTCSLVGVKEPNISVELVNTIVSTAEPKTERTENAEIPQGYKRILNNGAKGYTVASQRVVKESGKVIKTEKLTSSVYRAAPVEEEVNPLDINTPAEELKIYVPGMQIPKPTPEIPEAAETPETPPSDANPEQTENPPVEDTDTQDSQPTVGMEDEVVNV